MTTHVQIKACALNVRLKTTVRHASASRKKGAGIWVSAQSNGLLGFGEGCPRSYSAGDDVKTGLDWINDLFGSGKINFANFEELQTWMWSHQGLIDQYPSAWCAVETAYLDLFARQAECPVERIINAKMGLQSAYTAVLGDTDTWKYTYTADKYLIRGLDDFKIKLTGKIDKDREKIAILLDLGRRHDIPNLRIRVDANNLWKNTPNKATSYICDLTSDIYAVEEPVRAHDFKAIAHFGRETGLPVILDESLCTSKDLEDLLDLDIPCIANIKISRVGGILRALDMIEQIKKAGRKIIIGCHVGETSLLTRVGLIAAAAAGDALDAHEGAFGDYLVSNEPADPILKFSRQGRLNLARPYFYVNEAGLNMVPVDNWNKGLGISGRMPPVFDHGSFDIKTLVTSDGYTVHFRIWKNLEPEDAVLILHGGMSHSGWQAPLAKSILNLSKDITVVAADRRGCGLNENKGDLGSIKKLIDDIVFHVRHLKTQYKRVHLAGWCQGAQFAISAAKSLSNELSGLILLTPGLFWSDRFSSVLRTAEKVIWNMVSQFNLTPQRDRAFVPLPIEPWDFTDNKTWLDFIEQDSQKTTGLTLHSVSLMDEIQEMAWMDLFQIKIPMLTLLAQKDRMVDNDKVQGFIETAALKNCRLRSLDSGHAVQFEKPDEAAGHIIEFVNQRRYMGKP